jgi:hypothetical protein
MQVNIMFGGHFSGILPSALCGDTPSVWHRANGGTMVTTFDKKIVGVAVKLLAWVCAGNEDQIIDTLTGYLWDEEEASELKCTKTTE